MTAFLTDPTFMLFAAISAFFLVVVLGFVIDCITPLDRFSQPSYKK